MHRNMTTKRFVIILFATVSIGLIILATISLTIKPPTPGFHGKSTYPPLDIASGDINETDRKSVLPSFENITGLHSLSAKDVHMDPSTYQKTYHDDGGYIVQVSFYVPRVSSKYDIVFQYLATDTSLGLTLQCSATQPTSHECVDKNKEKVDLYD